MLHCYENEQLQRPLIVVQFGLRDDGNAGSVVAALIFDVELALDPDPGRRVDRASEDRDRGTVKPTPEKIASVIAAEYALTRIRSNPSKNLMITRFALVRASVAPTM